jgi:hypothetical protein
MEEKLWHGEVKGNADYSGRPVGRIALHDKRRDQTLEPENQSADARRHPRFKIEVDIRIQSRTCGALKGRTVDISESGIAAMLKIEVPLGEIVELSFTLPDGPVKLFATVRQKNAFRYGFEFVVPNTANETIRRTCRDLAVESLILTSVR